MSKTTQRTPWDTMKVILSPLQCDRHLETLRILCTSSPEKGAQTQLQEVHKTPEVHPSLTRSSGIRMCALT